MKKFTKIIPQLFYVAAALNFIASILCAINGKHDNLHLAIGGLCLVLGAFYSERAKKNKDKDDDKE